MILSTRSDRDHILPVKAVVFEYGVDKFSSMNFSYSLNFSRFGVVSLLFFNLFENLEATFIRSVIFTISYT